MAFAQLANGVIVIPIISGVNVDLASFMVAPPTWVWIITQEEPGYAIPIVDRVPLIVLATELTLIFRRLSE